MRVWKSPARGLGDVYKRQDLIKILVLRKALHRFRHAAYKIILLERINVGLLKARDHWIILLAEQLCIAFLAGGH